MPFAHTTIEEGEDRHAFTYAEHPHTNPWLPRSLAIHSTSALKKESTLGIEDEDGSRRVYAGCVGNTRKAGALSIACTMSSVLDARWRRAVKWKPILLFDLRLLQPTASTASAVTCSLCIGLRVCVQGLCLNTTRPNAWSWRLLNSERDARWD